MRGNSKKRKVIIIIAMLLAGIITGSAAFGYVYFGSGNNDKEGLLYNFESAADLEKRVSFLLIGTDKRPGESSYNSDSLVVANFDPDTKLISLLSIPRDTRVTLSGSKSFVKINAVPMLRGIPELEKQVIELTGIPLNGYILTNFDGFKDIIDTLGGITVNVEKNMYWETGDKVDGYINLKAGVQKLNGTRALQYARFRHDITADIGRTARQQKVLTAVAKEMLQARTITKLPKLIPQLMNAVETDLKLVDLFKLSGVVASFDSSNIVTQTLPGYGLYLDNISYWEVNRHNTKEVAQNLLLGITTDKVIDNTIIDLLDSEIKAHITVPGNSGDPNGSLQNATPEGTTNSKSGQTNTGQNKIKSQDNDKPSIEIIIK